MSGTDAQSAAFGLATQLNDVGLLVDGADERVEQILAERLSEWLKSHMEARDTTETFYTDEIARLKHEQKQEIAVMVKWIADLQRGMSINCVYCGHNFGPKGSTQAVMSDVLHEHIKVCPKHPLALAIRAFGPVADWYGIDHEDGPVPFHEALASAVADMICDRTVGLRLVEFVRQIRQRLPDVLHNHSLIQWLQQELPKLDQLIDVLHKEADDAIPVVAVEPTVRPE